MLAYVANHPINSEATSLKIVIMGCKTNLQNFELSILCVFIYIINRKTVLLFVSCKGDY